MLDIGRPENLLDVVLIQVVFLRGLNHLCEDFVAKCLHLVGGELGAKQHPHHFVEVVSVDFLIFVRVENSKVNLNR